MAKLSTDGRDGVCSFCRQRVECGGITASERPVTPVILCVTCAQSGVVQQLVADAMADVASQLFADALADAPTG